MKNLVIIALTPLAVFGAYSLFKSGTEINNLRNEATIKAAPIYVQADHVTLRPIPETCLLAEDTALIKPVQLKKDLDRHTVKVSRKDRPSSYVTIKF